MTEGLSNYAILVISSDKYQDIWNPFFECLERNWGNCPFQLYLGSNSIPYTGNTRVKTILSGIDKDWSSSMKIILSQIKEQFLFVILEDFFIITSPDNDTMINHFQFMENNNVHHMHFFNSVIPYDKELNENYGIYKKGAPYRSNVFGFWNKESMLGLLIDGESPWDFEIMGSYRSFKWDNFLSIKTPPFQILNVVEKGSYIAASVDYCKKNGITLSFETRNMLSGRKYFRSFMQAKYFSVMNKIPWRYRLGLMNILRKALVSY